MAVFQLIGSISVLLSSWDALHYARKRTPVNSLLRLAQCCRGRERRSKQVIKRLRWFHIGILFGYRHSQNSDLVVVGQFDALRTVRQVDRIREQIRVPVGHVRPFSVVMVRAIPRQVGALDIAWLDAGHLAVIVVRGIFRAPLPVVPLADESAPVLNIQLGLLPTDTEYGFLIAFRRGR